MIAALTPADLALWLADPERHPPQIIDVRAAWEFELAHLDHARLLPLPELPARFGEIDPSRPVVLVCHHGVRSYHAALFLGRQGYDALYNLEGGIDAWSCTVDPSLRRY